MQIDAAKSRNIEKINDSLNALKVEFGRFDARWSALQRQIGLVGRTSEDMMITSGTLKKTPILMKSLAFGLIKTLCLIFKN